MVVPAATESAREKAYEGKREALTFLGVDGDGVGRLVTFLVVRHHHGNLELF